jgi:thymidylate kinase
MSEENAIGKKQAQKILYLSGMPGSGKTTSMDAISADLGATKIPEFLESIPDLVLFARETDNEEQNLAAQLWTLNQHIRKDLLIKSLRGKIIVDRTWIDTVVYSLIYGKAVAKEIISKINEVDWSNGKNIILVTDLETARERLSERWKISKTDWEYNWEGFIKDLHYYYTAGVGELLGTEVIDTSHIAVNETLEKIKSIFLK